MLGNSFHCVVVAYLLSGWTDGLGYTVPETKNKKSIGFQELWKRTEDKVRNAGTDEVSVISYPEAEDDGEERVLHLVQEEETIAELHQCELPPDEYYEELGRKWAEWWPKADPKLLEHLMSVQIAFDTATAFAMSFGIAKFSLAQEQAKLVGGIVGRYGRSPNPAIVRAIKKWPPVYTLKQLQEFLGTINYVRPHCGPEYARVADPLRPLLRPTAVFPPNDKQVLAIEKLKELVLEHHRLCVPDEAAAIEAANAWLSGAPPAGRPYEIGADTSGYAIGGVCGQCDKNNGKLLALLYCTAHLAEHQQHWHSSEQELWGLLQVKREKNKQLGRIPNVTHTDHANLARLENLDLNRIDPKHYRWYQEIVEGGSLLLHRPGASALHKGPDGLSRNVEGRDQLILAKSNEWKNLRRRIKGICEAIEAGIAGDDEQEAMTIEKIEKENPEKLKPLPKEEGLAVSLNYERGSQEHKYKKPARGDQGGKCFQLKHIDRAPSKSGGPSSKAPIKTFQDDKIESVVSMIEQAASTTIETGSRGMK